jgi:hypothetical protein
MIWRTFSNMMTVFLGLLAIAEVYRYVTVWNDHMAVDTIICAGMTAFWIHHREEPGKQVAIDLSAALAVLMVIFVVFVAIRN